jgi:hypothetical protein
MTEDDIRTCICRAADFIGVHVHDLASSAYDKVRADGIVYDESLDDFRRYTAAEVAQRAASGQYLPDLPASSVLRKWAGSWQRALALVGD